MVFVVTAATEPNHFKRSVIVGVVSVDDAANHAAVGARLRSIQCAVAGGDVDRRVGCDFLRVSFSVSLNSGSVRLSTTLRLGIAPPSGSAFL